MVDNREKQSSVVDINCCLNLLLFDEFLVDETRGKC